MNKPGWGHPHTHVYVSTGRRIGALTIERCECGKTRLVVETKR